MIFCAIGSGIQIYYLTQGSSSLIALASSFEPLIIGLFGYAICAGLSSIIKHLLFIKEQQNLLLEEKGISVEFEEMPEAGLPNESEQE